MPVNWCPGCRCCRQPSSTPRKSSDARSWKYDNFLSNSWRCLGFFVSCWDKRVVTPPSSSPHPLVIHSLYLVNSHQRIIASLGTCSGRFRNWKECSSAPGNRLFLGIVSLQRCRFLPLLSSWPVPIIENFLLYSSESKAALSSRNEKIGSLLKERQGDVIPC